MTKTPSHVPEPPTAEEDLPGWLEWIAAITFRASIDLLERLHVETGEHRHFELAYDETTAKRYFLSRCLMDLQLTACSLLRLRDHVRAESAHDEAVSDGMRQVMLASVITEQSMWRRRLVEGLARLILFSQTNTDAHYFHYLITHDANEATFEAKNAKKDFDVTSETLKRRAAELQARLAQSGISLPVWYATGSAKDPRPAAATDVHRAALAVASAEERTALVHSYARGFSDPSSVIHFSTTARRRELDQQMLTFGAAHQLLLATAIARRIADLAGLTGSPGFARRIASPVTASAPQLPAVGDFVIVILDRENLFLAEVTAWKKHSGPLGGVCVTFLDESPYPGVTDDELPSELVQPFMRRDELLEGLVARAPETAELAEGDRVEAVRDAVRFVWKEAMHTVYLERLVKLGSAEPPSPTL